MVESGIVIEKPIRIINEVDKFILVKNDKAVSIEKAFSVSVKQETFDSKYNNSGKTIDGILGILEAKDNNYLMVIDSSTILGTLMDHKIFVINKLAYYSFSKTETKQSKEDEFHIKQINDFLNRNTLYFSPTLDLSISMQYIIKNNLHNQVSNALESSVFSSSNIHFVWNYENTRQIDSELLDGFLPIVINGFVGLKPIISYQTEFTYCLISRKDRRRSGCRFIVRGADPNGFVANFCESEQFIVINNNKKNEFNVLSYLQIRGSIPLIWNQLPNLQLNPPINTLNDFSAHSNAFNRHITQIVNSYERVTLVNLIDRKGDQLNIGDMYKNLFTNSKKLFQSNNPENSEPLVAFTWFDFHKECKKMKYENISNLLRAQSVSLALTNQEFTQFTVKKNDGKFINYFKNLEVSSVQKGVFRTNCIDNLDRTNVVQGVFARQFLHKMLFRLNLCEMPHGNPFEEFNPGFESTFRLIWGDNGDIISKAYSGTPALKRDFTRTGKRTIKGAIDDGINTSTRFYINNFCDGYNQDCHDLFLKQIDPRKKNFKKHSNLLVNSLFLLIFLCTFILYNYSVSISMKQNEEPGIKQSIFKILLFLGILVSSTLSLFNGLKSSIIDLSTISYH